MTITDIVALLGAATACVLALVTMFRERGTVITRFFSLAMLLMAAEACLGVMSLHALWPERFVVLQFWKLQMTAFLPGVWLLFSLCFARGNISASVKDWMWGLLAAFLIPLVLVIFFRESLFWGKVHRDELGYWDIDLGWAGQGLHLCTMGSWILVLMNLERTIRASVGVMRWQIKYMILGLVTLFVARLYTSSQTVLFHSGSYSLEIIKGWALLIACASMTYAFTRSRPFQTQVYPAQTSLVGSITGILTGVYLLVVGLSAKVVAFLGGDQAFPLKAFVVLISLFGLGVVWFSERLRHQIKHWLSRQFGRSLYDYRQLWTTFTENTSAMVDETALSRAVSKWISETFSVLSVTVWLTDESRKHFHFGASTSLSEAEGERLLQNVKVDSAFRQAVRSQPPVWDMDKTSGAWAETLKKFHPDKFAAGGHRFCVRLQKGEELLGFFTLGDRVNGLPYSLEDLDFLKCIGDQVAASLHHLQLSHRLLSAKEMATFQTVSAFFVHDLKNTASTLSLMLQNLPVHFDDPAFRQDALRAIGKSAQRINELIERLTQLRNNPDLNKAPASLNDLLTATIHSVRTGCAAELVEDFQPLPKITLDAEQIQKVAVNLILNASEASGKGGRIVISTRRQEDWMTFSVTDQGCGMNTEFISKSLFRPFQTTKKKGIGIGLFHTKMMVEAHHGKIEVESEVGKGTTFRVLLPWPKEQP